MKIQNGKIETDSFEVIMSNLYEKFSNLEDRIFTFKSGSILYNIFKLAAETEYKLQRLIEYIAEQVNPESSENFWQDALYERIGVSRLAPEPAKFTANLAGTANTHVNKNMILIKATDSGEEFKNTNDIIFNELGIAVVKFCATSSKYISLTPDTPVKIISAPSQITGIVDNTITDISQGRNKESDEDFRIRFRSSKALNARATHKANIANLSKYVDNNAFLKIFDRNTDITMDPNTVRIIVKHNTTNNEFAKAIFDTFGVGIKFIGNISALVKDSLGQNVNIKFTNANDIPIDIKIKLKISENYNIGMVLAQVKEAILTYVKKRVFGLESIIYATEFIVPTLSIDGVEAATESYVKKDIDENYTDIINLAEDEVPEFTASYINLEVVE